MIQIHPFANTSLFEINTGNQGVLSAAAAGLNEFILNKGADAAYIFDKNGVHPDLLNSPTLSIQLPNYCQMLEQAASLSGCDNFGLEYGQQFQPKSLGLIGYIGLCSPNLASALQNIANYFHFHQKDTLMQFVAQDDCWRIDYQVQHGAILCRRQDAELTLGMIMNVIRGVLGQNYSPRAVHFEHARPIQWQEHRKLFNAPVFFEQPYNSIVIKKSDTYTPMPDADPILLKVIQDTLKLLNQNNQRQDLLNQARSRIQLSLSQGEPCLEQIATELNMSNTCFIRKLKIEGTNFSKLVDSVRCELAKNYMAQTHIQISEIAFLLGYSELSAFSRAFKRWFNITPRQWRH
ncbi:AraC family transcriptional regulator [Acinetobacter nectaris]|uniref:AraC-like transcriptional regulator QhpR n=1 Tax=Acinetobacter nectaris TaxID=1219382 RepID=UPI001F420BB5|nr:AraC family transcriptional regulator [Acinetobacter nectaris]MCF8998775.1 AraC family transcriptional regulator [Acinetobacter nectaris]MCF9027984.1 AraC family transcriptional regulator [Acinetobacter nectaris]